MFIIEKMFKMYSKHIQIVLGKYLRVPKKCLTCIRKIFFIFKNINVYLKKKESKRKRETNKKKRTN